MSSATATLTPVVAPSTATASPTPITLAPEPTTPPATRRAAKKKPAPGRTALERAERAVRLEQLRREQVDESKKFRRFSAQHIFVLVTLLVLAAFMAAASFLTSFTGLYGAASWAIGDENPWLKAAAPLMYDGAIIAFTVKLFMDKEEGEKVLWTWVWIAVLASISSVVNIFHTVGVSTATNFPQLIVGCVISGSAPFLLALVVDVAASKVFRKPEART
ncbi:DUF2637 domain-containing protein [Leifsonia aquatica]|uniref:DUF2637 domain-containing protein n=1 Tax=Leifsonia aquatica TaxID=144185 RepID=UPI0004683922|nr:DUF2637 domain-containing protein [Leifsonia aquatica]